MNMFFDMLENPSIMGYMTNFLGEFVFSRPLTNAEFSFLDAFSKSQRMRLDTTKLEEFQGMHSEPYTRSYGTEGSYFAHELPHNHPAILDSNEPPQGQPGLLCHWWPTMTSLKWNNAEKFYCYAEWLEYLVIHFFEPWGIQLNGAIQWQGEDPDDRGVLSMRNNNLFVHYEDRQEDSEGATEEDT